MLHSCIGHLIMNYLYAPGCALVTYKPELADQLKTYIETLYGPMDTLLTCCFNAPKLEDGTCIITPCATCALHYQKLYPNCTVKFFLEELAERADFPFPNYEGMHMSIQDTCSARTQPHYLQAIRTLIQRMNIVLDEPEKTGAKAKCCGQLLYGKVSSEKLHTYIENRANEMPCQDVIVYCASCIMSMTVGGKQPRYLLDLLFSHPTHMQGVGVDAWNQRLKEFRRTH